MLHLWVSVEWCGLAFSDIEQRHRLARRLLTCSRHARGLLNRKHRRRPRSNDDRPSGGHLFEASSLTCLPGYEHISTSASNLSYFFSIPYFLYLLSILLPLHISSRIYLYYLIQFPYLPNPPHLPFPHRLQPLALVHHHHPTHLICLPRLP